jgi:hypothetical protein
MSQTQQLKKGGKTNVFATVQGVTIDAYELRRRANPNYFSDFQTGARTKERALAKLVTVKGTVPRFKAPDSLLVFLDAI